MEDKKLNEKESLELITQMIQNTRQNLDTGSGNMFLVWGYVSVLVTLTVLAGVYFTKNPLWMWGFWGIPVMGYLLTFLLMRKRQKMVKSYIDKILVQVWRMFGLICMIFVLMATDLERYEVILPMGAIVMSMGSIITGCIIRYTTFFIFPAMGLMWGMKSFFDALNSGTSYVPLLFVGTEFQKSVWYKLLEIPYGSTVSYGELAKQLDLPKAVRAVAAANGANAISIFAPCHRVIGSNHSLVGYGGGLPAKKRLLDLELNGKPLL